MIGVTARDKHDLWKIPYEALEKSGVDISHIEILEDNEPGFACITTQDDGDNSIYFSPGVNDAFTPDKIDSAYGAFSDAKQGIAVLSLEAPVDTVMRALECAEESEMRSIIDPGGITQFNDAVKELLQKKIFCLKPNEHETKLLTGVMVDDFESAKEAYEKLSKYSMLYVMITHGVNGAYVFGENLALHIPIPDIKIESETKDATGCGDQTTAMLAAELSKGVSFEEAARSAVRAGTLQFHRLGIQPVTTEEYSQYS